MKRTFLLFLSFLLVTIAASSQSFKYGLKAGFNYNFSGDLKETKEISDAAKDIQHGAKNKVGYHGGLWLKFQPNNLFVRTEAVYSEYTTSFDNDSSLKAQTIDVPVHFGSEIIWPLYLFAGPDFLFMIDNEFSENSDSVVYDNFTLGVNLGLGLSLGNFSAELKWDKALTGEKTLISDKSALNNFEADNRPNQLVFSLLIGF